jgi:hypothetical protein
MAFLMNSGCAFDISNAARAHFHPLSTFARPERATDRCNGRFSWPTMRWLPRHAHCYCLRPTTHRRPRISKAVFCTIGQQYTTTTPLCICPLLATHTERHLRYQSLLHIHSGNFSLTSEPRSKKEFASQSTNYIDDSWSNRLIHTTQQQQEQQQQEH